MKHTERKQFRIGSALALIGQMLRILGGLLTVPLTVTYLGPSEYGLWITLATFSSALSVLESAFMPGAKNAMSSAYARGDDETFSLAAEAAQMAAAILALFAVGAAIASIKAPIQDLLLLREPSIIRKAHQGLAILGAASALGIATSHVEAIYSGRLRPIPLQIAKIVAAIVSVASVLLVIRMRWGLESLILSTSLPYPIARLVLYCSLRDSRPRLTTMFSRQVAKMTIAMTPDSVVFLYLQLANVAVSSVPSVAVARWYGLNGAAQFGIVQKMSTVPLLAVSALMPVVWPVLSVSWTRQEYGTIRRNITAALVATVCGVTLQTVLLTAYGNSILSVISSRILLVDNSLFAAFGFWVLTQCVVAWMSTCLNSIGVIAIQVKAQMVQVLLQTVFLVVFAGTSTLSSVVWLLAATTVVANAIPLTVIASRALNQRLAVTRCYKIPSAV